MESTVHSLVYQTGESKHEPPYHYTRTPTDSVTLIAGHGIEGDLKAGHNPNRQLNILTFEIVEQLREEGYKANPGELGEQITIRGLDLVPMPEGTRVQLGSDAVIEVVKPRTGCDWFEQIHEKPRPTNRLGVMARVIVSGIVKVGDAVKLVIPEVSATEGTEVAIAAE